MHKWYDSSYATKLNLHSPHLSNQLLEKYRTRLPAKNVPSIFQIPPIDSFLSLKFIIVLARLRRTSRISKMIHLVRPHTIISVVLCTIYPMGRFVKMLHSRVHEWKIFQTPLPSTLEREKFRRNINHINHGHFGTLP